MKVLLRFLAWLPPGLSAALVVVGLAAMVQSASWPPHVQVNPQFVYLLLALAFPTVGALIAHRYPANLVGWLLCAVGLASGAELTQDGPYVFLGGIEHYHQLVRDLPIRMARGDQPQDFHFALGERLDELWMHVQHAFDATP
jgi:hypothetical protein